MPTMAKNPLLFLLLLAAIPLASCASHDHDGDAPHARDHDGPGHHIIEDHNETPEHQGMPEMPEGMGDFEMPKPGAEHAWLAGRVGTWALTSNWRMIPDQPWMTSKGREVVSSACGGFWVSSVQTGDMMGLPFDGRSLMGFDQNKQKYVGVWIDNFGSYMVTMEGARDPATGDLIMRSEMFDPQSGQTIPVRMVTKVLSDDRALFEMWLPSPAGGEFKSMFIEYERL